LQAAAIADNTEAQLEFAIALFNGTGIAKNENAAAALLRRAAARGNPVAQNRLARALAYGRGAPMDRGEALKWHLLAKAGGASDPALDEQLAQVTPEQKANAEAAAARWLGGR
jgi:TPR repeat protein